MSGRAPRFFTTRWSLVAAAAPRDAGRLEGAEPGQALAELCEAYWYPLYVWLRRRGTPEHEAADLVQGFVADLLERGHVNAEAGRGRFRSYLLGALRNYVANVDRAARAQRRGGGQAPVSIDGAEAEERYRHEPADGTDRSPEAAFARRWALDVLERAFARLSKEQEDRGLGGRFAALRGTLGGEDPRDHAALAAQLGISVSAIKVSIHRLRTRLRELIRSEVADTVATGTDVDAEVADLFEALG